jgi:C_GCAxxG_C_C family probable redox protein
MTRQLWCSGAVLVVLNRTFNGPLDQETAIRLCAGLGDGMGGSGCLCGGLNGAALALGLLLGNGRLAPGGDPPVLQATNRLHRRFKSIYGSTCCRVLTKKVSMGSERQYLACADRTGKAAELAAGIILEARPELAAGADWDYLNRLDSKFGARIKIVADRLKN